MVDLAHIVEAAKLAQAAGTTFVKISTGFNGFKGATPEAVRAMCEATNNMPVKASGGIRTLQDAFVLYLLGATRFGVGYKTAETMLADGQSIRPNASE